MVVCLCVCSDISTGPVKLYSRTVVRLSDSKIVCYLEFPDGSLMSYSTHISNCEVYFYNVALYIPLMMLCTGIQGTLPGVAAPSIQAQLYRIEQHYHLQKEMLSRQFEEDQRLLEHEKQQYKMQVQHMLCSQFHWLISDTKADVVMFGTVLCHILCCISFHCHLSQHLYFKTNKYIICRLSMATDQKLQKNP